MTRNNSQIGQFEQFYADWDVSGIRAELELEAEAYREGYDCLTGKEGAFYTKVPAHMAAHFSQ